MSKITPQCFLTLNGKSPFQFEIITLEPCPPYVILSHAWGKPEDDVSYSDIATDNPDMTKKRGYRKIQQLAELAKENDIRYMWVETCCINQDDQHDVKSTIGDMFHYYKNVKLCCTIIDDLISQEHADKKYVKATTIACSKWNTRGWTLQEFLAPPEVIFTYLPSTDDTFSDPSPCHITGTKTELAKELAQNMDLPEDILGRQRPLSKVPVEERLT